MPMYRSEMEAALKLLDHELLVLMNKTLRFNVFLYLWKTEWKTINNIFERVRPTHCYCIRAATRYSRSSNSKGATRVIQVSSWNFFCTHRILLFGSGLVSTTVGSTTVSTTGSAITFASALAFDLAFNFNNRFLFNHLWCRYCSICKWCWCWWGLIIKVFSWMHRNNYNPNLVLAA